MAKKDGFSLRLNEKGLNQSLRKHLPKSLRSKANEVGKKVGVRLPDDVEVSVSEGITERGRPYSMVTIRDIRGLVYQARDGVLSSAAISSGLDLTRYPLVEGV